LIRALRRSAVFFYFFGLAVAGFSLPKEWSLGSRSVPGPLPPQPGAVSPALDVEFDIVYGQADGESLKLDFAKPSLCRSEKVPLIVYVHGGGWTSGDKAGAFSLPTINMAFELGFAVAAINYRLAPQNRFPAQIYDCKLAIRFLRSHAGELGIDPDRIAAAGGSAGGHLVSLLATADDKDGLDGPGLSGISSRVTAVVEQFGPTSLADTETPATQEGLDLVSGLLGCNPYLCPDLAKQASPITYVTPDDPPIMILHGDKDTLVPYRQAEVFAEALREAGVTCTLIKVKNAEHAFIPSPLTASIVPSEDGIAFLSVAHLARYLEPSLFGDLNMDGTKNARDFQWLVSCLGFQGVGPYATPAPDSWNPLADLVPDGIIDFKDILEFLRKSP
jgi:acetyl esterase/lipase